MWICTAVCTLRPEQDIFFSTYFHLTALRNLISLNGNLTFLTTWLLHCRMLEVQACGHTQLLTWVLGVYARSSGLQVKLFYPLSRLLCLNYFFSKWICQNLHMQLIQQSIPRKENKCNFRCLKYSYHNFYIINIFVIQIYLVIISTK